MWLHLAANSILGSYGYIHFDKERWIFIFLIITLYIHTPKHFDFVSNCSFGFYFRFFSYSKFSIGGTK